MSDSRLPRGQMSYRVPGQPAATRTQAVPAPGPAALDATAVRPMMDTERRECGKYTDRERSEPVSEAVLKPAEWLVLDRGWHAFRIELPFECIN